MLPATPSPASPARKGGSTLLPAARPAAITVGAFGVLVVVIQLVNSLMHYSLSQHFGIVSRSVSGLVGIASAPLLHASWSHLLSNVVPLLVLGFLIMAGGVRQFVAVTILVWLISGLGVWLAGPSHTITVGASALVFGWLTYLVFRGIFTRNIGQVLIGVVMLAIWGGIFWTGIVHVALGPSNTGISWQGHLFGAIGGVLAAFLAAKADGPRRKAPAGPPALPLRA